MGQQDTGAVKGTWESVYVWGYFPGKREGGRAKQGEQV